MREIGIKTKGNKYTSEWKRTLFRPTYDELRLNVSYLARPESEQQHSWSDVNANTFNIIPYIRYLCAKPAYPYVSFYLCIYVSYFCICPPILLFSPSLCFRYHSIPTWWVFFSTFNRWIAVAQRTLASFSFLSSAQWFLLPLPPAAPGCLPGECFQPDHECVCPHSSPLQSLASWHHDLLVLLTVPD